MADLQSGGNGRDALDFDHRDRATLGRSVFTHSSAGARSHRKLWTLLGNWIGAGRAGDEPSRDRSRHGDHPGIERVPGIADSVTHPHTSAVAHTARAYVS